MFISPVQLPLHELYFDLTLIRIKHTKIPVKITLSLEAAHLI